MRPGSEHRNALFIGAIVAFSYGYFFHFQETIPNPNETARLYLTLAIVDEGTLSINKVMAKHGVVWDRAERGGKIYSDKAPGLSVLAVPGYALAKWTSELFGEPLSYAGAHAAARWGAVILPTVVFCSFLYLFLGSILPDPRLRVLLVLVYALGSLSRTYGVLFFGHQTAAVLSCGGVLLLWRYGRVPGGRALTAMLLGGLMIGASFSVEYPMFLAALIAGFLALWAARPWWRLAPLCIAVALPVLLCLWYNQAAFGDPFSPGYAHLTSSFAAVHDKGLFGVTTPKLDAFYGSFFSPARGLFVYSPWLLAAIPGCYFLIREPKLRALGIAVAALFAGYIYFISSFGYWVGGDSAGPRHLTPLVPVLVLAVAAAMARMQKTSWEGPRLLFAAAVVFSLVLVHFVSATFSFFEPRFPNPYRDVTLEFWREGAFPRSLGTALGLEGLVAALPAALPALFAIVLAVMLLSRGERHRPAPLRLAAMVYPLAFAALALALLLRLAPESRDGWASHEAYRYMTELRPPRLTSPPPGPAAADLAKGNFAALKGEPQQAIDAYRRSVQP